MSAPKIKIIIDKKRLKYIFTTMEHLYRTIYAFKSLLNEKSYHKSNSRWKSLPQSIQRDNILSNMIPENKYMNSINSSDFSNSIVNYAGHDGILERENIAPSSNKSVDPSNKENEENKPLMKKINLFNKSEYTFPYFKKLQYILLIITTISNCYLIMFSYALSMQKNNSYCFDHFNRQFRICSKEDICTKGINTFIFNNSIYNSDIVQEAREVNKMFTNFFLRDFFNFIYFNDKISTTDETSQFYFVKIVLTKKEKFLLSSQYHLSCNESFHLEAFLIIVVLGYIIGNIIFGIFSDIFGRRRNLIILLFIQFISGYLIVIITFTINTDKINFKYEDYQDIVNYLHSRDYEYFGGLNKTKLYEQYIQEFNDIHRQTLTTKRFQKSFHKYSIWIYLLYFFLAASCYPPIGIGKAYLFEHSLNEDFANVDFFRIGLSRPLSLVITFLLVSFVNNLMIILIILSTSSGIMGIIVWALLFESIRYHYEFSQYDQITYILKSVFKQTKFIEKDTNPLFVQLYTYNRKEFDLMNANAAYSICKILLKSNCCYQFSNIFSSEFDYISNKEKPTFKKEYFIYDPFLIFKVLARNRQFKKNFFINFAFVFLISFIYEIVNSYIYNDLIFSRHNIHKNYVFNQITIYFAFVEFASMFIFSLLLKILDVFYLSAVTLIATLVFSLIYEVLSISFYEVADITAYNYYSNQMKHEMDGTKLIIVNFFAFFFSIGLRFTTYFYLTKLTKTIYRCTFYGIYNALSGLAFFYSHEVQKLFYKNFFYVALFDCAALINLLFVASVGDSRFISDMHEINENTIENADQERNFKEKEI